MACGWFVGGSGVEIFHLEKYPTARLADKVHPLSG